MTGLLTTSQHVRELFRRLADEPRRIVFPFTLPARNELDDLQRRHFALYNRTKKKCQDDVVLFARRYHWAPTAPGQKLIIAINWREPDRRRDPSNVIDGGRKILLDGIAGGRRGPRGWNGAGLIHCDGHHCLSGVYLDIVTALPGVSPGIELVVAPVQLELPIAREAREVVLDLR
jgi:hypothetical protein